MVEQLMAEYRHELRATATWFVLLAQHLAAWEPKDQISRDSCYPTAFELAVRHGDPDPATADTVAADALGEVAETRGGRTPATLRHALDDPHLRSTLSARLTSLWDAPAADPVPAALSETDCLLFLDTFVSGEPLVGDERRTAEQAWAAVVGAGTGSQTGQALRADLWPTTLSEPARARRLGLTEAETPPRPELDRTGTSQARCPWDRSVAERVLGVLKHSSDRTALPGLTDLLTEEVERVCAPWEVGSEPSRAVLVLGTVLATGLVADQDAGRTRAHRIVASMRRRESWLAWAQRQPTVPESLAGRRGSEPADGPGTGDGPSTELVALSVELADPVAPYLRRLWVRLHGAEVRGTLPAGVEEVQSLLLGVSRSVLLDGRSRVRAALTRLQDAPADPAHRSDPPEPASGGDAPRGEQR